MRALLLMVLCAALGWAEGPVLPPAERLQAQALAFVQAQVEGRDGAYTFKVISTAALPRTKGELVFEPARLSRQEVAGRFYVTVNVFSDSCCAVLVARSEGEKNVLATDVFE